ncbi:MAG TPA: hypothetical protein VFW45_06320 [Candidatus Polarisedimenticolia bacterium]|nr:hypothetical protein [Candidatus Polarisedimenticolia bacterium]
MKSDRWLWVIIVLGSAVRLFGLGERSLSYDECQQFWASQGNALVANREITLDPPGFAVLLHLHSLAARGETWLRLLPCLIGIAAIPAVYLLARRATGDLATSRAAAFFFALAPYPIRYAQSLRVYSLTLLFGALLPAVWLAMMSPPGGVSERDRPSGDKTRTASFMLLGLTAFGGMLAMYGMLWLCLAILAATWLPGVTPDSTVRRRTSIALLAGMAAAAPAYAFSIPGQMARGTPASFYEDKFLPRDGLLPALRFFAGGILDLSGYFSFILPIAGALFGALAVIGMVNLWRRSEGRAATTAFLLGVSAAAAGSALWLYPFGATRQMLYAAPLFYVLSASGIMALRGMARGALSAALLIAIATGSAIFLERYHAEPGGQEMRPVMAYLEHHVEPGDRILVNKDAIPQFRYYYHGSSETAVLGRETVIRDFTAEAAQLMRAAPQARWWLLFSHGWTDERRSHLRDLEPGYRLADTFEAHRAATYLFVPTTP